MFSGPWSDSECWKSPKSWPTPCPFPSLTSETPSPKPILTNNSSDEHWHLKRHKGKIKLQGSFHSVMQFGATNYEESIEQAGNGPSRRRAQGKQAGTGPSRRHILGSQIAKGLQNVKVLVNWGPFYEKIKWKKSLTMPKKLKGGTLWDFSTSILSINSEKIEGGPFGEKIPQKRSRNAENNWKGGPFGLVRY